MCSLFSIEPTRLTQTPQCRRPCCRCPMSTTPRSLAAPLKAREERLWRKLPGKIKKSKRGFGLSHQLTCHFDLLHYLACAIVDFHLNIDGIAVVINLDLRKYLQSKKKKVGKHLLDFRSPHAPLCRARPPAGRVCRSSWTACLFPSWVPPCCWLAQTVFCESSDGMCPWKKERIKEETLSLDRHSCEFESVFQPQVVRTSYRWLHLGWGRRWRGTLWFQSPLHRPATKQSVDIVSCATVI